MKKALFFLFSLFSLNLLAQTNIHCTDSTVAHILLGDYNPANYLPSKIIDQPDSIFLGINARINPDSLKADILTMSGFFNRNTASDTISNTTGMGAARRWAYSKFNEYSFANQNRLLPCYLQFTFSTCGVSQHRNVMAVLPAIDTADKSIIIIEGHLDSRCADVCDTTSKAKGIEDNASGAALVLELARVMSHYSYHNTIIFMLTTGEEQGLYGGYALADYAVANKIKIKAVLNNDVIGGIICGKTSSAPSCPGYGNLDSTQVRLFSFGGFNSAHKGLSRFIKLEYKENLSAVVALPMQINVMTPEDRSGRGGDHIPFRSNGFTAMRFTAANEDGDANVTDTAYHDRQHTTGDSLGTYKVNGPHTSIDSLFVNFPYLARNAVINGNAAGMLGIGPMQPDFSLTTAGNNALRIQVTKQTQYKQYRIGVRMLTNDWDSVYTMTGTLIDTIKNLSPGVHDVSIMSVDTNGIESLPSTEYKATVTAIDELPTENKGIQLLQNRPNPFDISTYISVEVNEQVIYNNAYISIRDMKGAEVKRLPIKLNTGINEVIYDHGYGAMGTYVYTLVIDGKPLQSRQMIFAN